MLYGLFFLCVTLNVISIGSVQVRWKRALVRPEPSVQHLESAKAQALLRSRAVPQSPPYFIQQRPDLRRRSPALSSDNEDDPRQQELKNDSNWEKREAEKRGENEAAYVLVVNPPIPRNIWSVRDYKNASCEKYRHHWCLELPSSTPRICPADDTLTPGPTECGPTRPQKYGTAYPYCDFDRTFLPKPRDLCDPTCEDVPSSTIYVACVSRLPPTLEPNFKFCCPTSMPCHNHTAVDRIFSVPQKPSTCPPSTTPCDEQPPAGKKVLKTQSIVAGPLQSASLQGNNDHGRYYVLLKRSPRLWNRKRRLAAWRGSSGRRTRC